VLYQLAGLAQQQRALDAGWQLAAARGHQPLTLVAKPSFGNILLWRVIYQHDGHFYSDGVRAGWQLRRYPGRSIPALDTLRDFPWLDPASQQARDIARFDWFSQGYTAVDPANPERVVDVRYAMLPTEVDGLWGIRLSRQRPHDQHADYIVARELKPATRQRFWQMLNGR